MRNKQLLALCASAAVMLSACSVQAEDGVFPFYPPKDKPDMKLSEAIERYRALLLLAPESRDYAVLLAQSLNEAGLPEQALATLGQAYAEGVGESDSRVFLTIAESSVRTGPFECSTRPQCRPDKVDNRANALSTRCACRTEGTS